MRFTSTRARELKTADKNGRSDRRTEETEDFFYQIRYPIGKPGTRVVGADGSFGRVFVVRLRPGTDLLKGIRETCEKGGVKAGVVLSAFGSLQKCCLGYVRPAPEPAMKSALDFIRLTGPLEFIGSQGTISETTGGDVFLHVHGIVADRHNRVYAGHFIEGENVALANVEIVIAEIRDVKMGRTMEPELGGELLTPSKERSTRVGKSKR